MPDETFLPDTTLQTYSYRGAYGQAVAGPGNDSMNPSMGCCGFAGVDLSTVDAKRGGLLASLALAVFDEKRRSIWLGAAALFAIGSFMEKPQAASS